MANLLPIKLALTGRHMDDRVSLVSLQQKGASRVVSCPLWFMVAGIEGDLEVA